MSHNWCYFFEKAELNHQAADYQKVVDLYSQAKNSGASPLNSTEYYPFIDSLARTGKWDQAEKLTLQLLPTDRMALSDGLCYIWKNLKSDFPTSQYPAQVISKMSCHP
jgi:hypothetical protein